MGEFVVGDIHGGYKSLLQCFDRSGFDYNKDKLIALGDVCDGWPNTRECISELLKIKNLIYILGNHDAWALDWMLTGIAEDIWTSQGGYATIESYSSDPLYVPIAHRELLNVKAVFYHIDKQNRVFVHGGFDRKMPIEMDEPQNLMWDRELLRFASERERYYRRQGTLNRITEYNEIFIGHTSTSFYNTLEPMHVCEIWNLDTGGGYEGKLTIMNIETHEYWQSDNLNTLYPNYKGR